MPQQHPNPHDQGGVAEKKRKRRRIHGRRGGRMGGLENHRWREKSEQKKIDVWMFPELGAGCLEVEGWGPLAPGLLFFTSCFSLQCLSNQTGGLRKSKGHSPRFLFGLRSVVFCFPHC